MSRKPDSNDPPTPKLEGRWLDTSELMDEFALILSGDAVRCGGCKRATSLKYLMDGKCPDCRPGSVVNPNYQEERRPNYGASSDGDWDAE